MPGPWSKQEAEGDNVSKKMLLQWLQTNADEAFLQQHKYAHQTSCMYSH